MNFDLQKISLKKIVILAVFALVCYAVFLVVRNQFFFFAKSASPRNNSTVSSTVRTATITFNKDLDPSQDHIRSVVVKQRGFIKKIHVEKNKLVLELASLDINKTYALEFPEIKSKQGKIIKNFKYTIHTKFVPFNELSAKEQEQAIAGVDQGNFDDPILDFIPYETATYAIMPVFVPEHEGGAQFIVRITAKISRADSTDVEKYKNKYYDDARTYLTSKGININNYTFDYEAELPPGLAE